MALIIFKVSKSIFSHRVHPIDASDLLQSFPPPQRHQKAEPVLMLGFSNGSAVISSSFNIASVPTPGTGKYDYTFITPMPNANYCSSSNLITLLVMPVVLLLLPRNQSTGFSVSAKTAGGDGFTNQQHSVVVHHASNATLPETISKEQIDALEARPTLQCMGHCWRAMTDIVREFNVATCKKGGGAYYITFTHRCRHSILGASDAIKLFSSVVLHQHIKDQF